MSGFIHPSGPALLCGLSLGSLAYGASKALGLPVLLYLPIEGSWTWSPPPDVITMSYYGLCLNAAFGMLLGLGLGGLPVTMRRFATEAGARVLIGFTSLAVVIGVTLSVGAEMTVLASKSSTDAASVRTQSGPLGVGDALPDFRLQTDGGGWVSRSALLGKGPIVLFFYPKDNTSGCTREACSFRDEMANFDALGAQVFGVSSDSVSSHNRFVDDYNLNYPLLADTNSELRKALGVPKTLGIIAGRVTYVIDSTGVIRHVYNSQIGVFQHVEEALSAVRELVEAGS